MYPMNIAEMKARRAELRKELKSATSAKAERLQREIDDLSSMIKARQEASGSWLYSK